MSRRQRVAGTRVPAVYVGDVPRIREVYGALRRLSASGDAWATARLERFDAGDAVTEEDAREVVVREASHHQVGPEARACQSIELEPPEVRPRTKPARTPVVA